jgi:replicative DNA helicase
LIKRWKRRVLNQIAIDVVNEEDPDDVGMETVRRIESLLAKAALSPVKDGKYLADKFEAWRRDALSGSVSDYIRTDYHQIDSVTGGLPIGGVTVIGARPGVGKSTLIKNFMENLANRGVRCAAFSLEMQDVGLTRKIVASVAGIDSRCLNKYLDRESEAAIAQATEMLRSWPVEIDDSPVLDVRTLRWKTKAMVKRGARVVFGDYVQLTQSSDNRKRFEQIAEMTRESKLLAMELGISFVWAAQLARGEGRPTLQSFRESGNIEQDADVALLLSFEDPENKEPQVNVCCDIAKCRTGQIGQIQLLFNKPHQRFL